ncbi:MAG: hypothetical protein IJH09_08500 [Clostridia bacterium]|nr:hypothetical protein [Clostridia bacterium]
MSRFDVVAPYVILSGAASAAQSKDLEDWFRALALQGMTGFDVDGPYAVVKLQISIVMASQGTTCSSPNRRAFARRFLCQNRVFCNTFIPVIVIFEIM